MSNERYDRGYPQALKRIEELEAELLLMKTSGIVEVAVRNPSVMEYMKHWESRAETAEAKLEKAVEALKISKGYVEDAAEGICYVCQGDCSSAATPQVGCPMAEYQSDLKQIRAALKVSSVLGQSTVNHKMR